ncbi:LuxR C-terminal-related transcriptional regulator [Xanthobacter autotrophicus DSM 431]|uniref:helix-turn-helix transcriptional regulator n=1 Tax=Xanthobacter nonsaccharivorans TaxID=3119912 RepID=UPI00372AA345
MVDPDQPRSAPLPARYSAVRLNSPEWFARVGEVARVIGSDRFHRELVELAGAAINHDACWIIRYSRVAPPDVLYTKDVASDVVAYYSNLYSSVDPFSEYWKNNGSPGVLMLNDVRSPGRAWDMYHKVFQTLASISDELGMFFSTVGHCCFGLFLERETGRFSQSDIERARLIFPMLEGFHRSHLGALFNDLRNPRGPQVEGFITRPTLIEDRFGVDVFANEAWREAAQRVPALADAVAALRVAPAGETHVCGSLTVKVEVFDRDFPLAPGGRMYVLDAPQREAGGDPDRLLEDALGIFTPREREILLLLMNGQTTGEIAQKLSLSKGTIKNCRLRMYRKAGVGSERALVKHVMQSIGAR